jgi:acyl phosphate:glycerol-3-phosphate acyltransferase
MSQETIFVIVWTFVAFISGSLPFSIWVSRFFGAQDSRTVGDGNPGATNALKAAGWKAGLLVLMLDITKGALPVGLAFFTFAIQGPEVIPIALAPTLGHAFSPFLGGRGGKALAVSLGVWIGLTLWEVSLVSLGLLIFWYLFLKTDAWSVLLTLVSLILYLVLVTQNSVFISIGLLQTLVILYKHREGYQSPPQLRSWLYANSGKGEE